MLNFYALKSNFETKQLDLMLKKILIEQKKKQNFFVNKTNSFSCVVKSQYENEEFIFLKGVFPQSG